MTDGLRLITVELMLCSCNCTVDVSDDCVVGSLLRSLNHENSVINHTVYIR